MIVRALLTLHKHYKIVHNMKTGYIYIYSPSNIINTVIV
jgi:hypothetical protein